MTLTWPAPVIPSWRERAWRYRTEQANWCELCERRTWHLGPITFRVELEVHHCNGRGIINPVGLETDAELMTLCKPCHRKITNVHQTRRRVENRWRRAQRLAPVSDLEYAHFIAEATSAARVPYLRRAWWRLWLQLPPQRRIDWLPPGD
jgi:hypothetical protein